MEIQTQEARIILAIEAIRASKTLKPTTAGTIYNVPRSTLLDRMNGCISFREYRPAAHKLTELKEEVIVRNILE